MHLAAVIHSLDGGGAERSMAMLAGSLTRRGHRVDLITLGDGSHDRHAVDPAVHRIPLGLADQTTASPFGKLAGTARRLRSIRRVLTESHYDIALSFCDWTNVNVLLSMTGHPLPIVVAERSDPRHQTLPQPWQTLRRNLYAHAACVITQTIAATDYLQPITGGRYQTIPSAIDPPPAEITSSDRTAAWNRKTITAIGRLSPEKGFDRLIEAFHQIADDHPGWTLRIVGDGPSKTRLRQQSQRLGRQHAVEFLSWQTPIWPLYANASMVVIPSRYEGFPSVMLESMAAGVPTIAIESLGGVAETIDDQINGLHCGPHPTDIADAIRFLITHPDRAARIGEAARQVLHTHHADRMTDQFESVLQTARARP